jgi:hypothetical protein
VGVVLIGLGIDARHSDARRLYERTKLITADSPQTVSVEAATAYPPQDEPLELSLHAQIAAGPGGALAAQADLTDLRLPQIMLLLDPEAQADTKIARAAIFYRMSEESAVHDWLRSRTLSTGPRGPIVEIDGLWADPALAPNIGDALAERGLVAGDGFFLVEPFFRGRAETLSTLPKASARYDQLYFVAAALFMLMALMLVVARQRKVKQIGSALSLAVPVRQELKKTERVTSRVLTRPLDPPRRVTARVLSRPLDQPATKSWHSERPAVPSYGADSEGGAKAAPSDKSRDGAFAASALGQTPAAQTAAEHGDEEGFASPRASGDEALSRPKTFGQFLAKRREETETPPEPGPAPEPEIPAAAEMPPEALPEREAREQGAGEPEAKPSEAEPEPGIAVQKAAKPEAKKKTKAAKSKRPEKAGAAKAGSSGTAKGAAKRAGASKPAPSASAPPKPAPAAAKPRGPAPPPAIAPNRGRRATERAEIDSVREALKDAKTTGVLNVRKTSLSIDEPNGNLDDSQKKSGSGR